MTPTLIPATGRLPLRMTPRLPLRLPSGHRLPIERERGRPTRPGAASARR